MKSKSKAGRFLCGLWEEIDETPISVYASGMMTAAKKLNLTTVQEYLAGELLSEVKHEYLGGVVHAMAGASNLHNQIAINAIGVLHTALRGKPCGVWNSDTKIRIQLPTHTRFYYPDASVVCSENSPEDSYQEQPVVIIEVLSESTRRTDEVEKLDAYRTISTLRVYLLVEQQSADVTVYRRTDEGFVRELYSGLDAVIPLSEVGAELPLAQIYEQVVLAPSPMTS